MNILTEQFGTLPEGAVYAYTMTAKSGAYVRLLNLGGILQSLTVPDRSGIQIAESMYEITINMGGCIYSKA